MELFLAVQDADKQNYTIPLSSCALLYIIRYCSISSVKVTLVKVSTKYTCIDVKQSCLDGFCYTCIDKNDVPQEVNNCDLPVIQDEDGQIIRSGLCSCVRHLVSYASARSGDDTMLDLLGFRCGSLKACAEVSGWTRLCEVELPASVGQLMNIVRSSKHEGVIEIPPDVMKIELNLEKPPPLHNDDKKKRAFLNRVKKEFTVSQPINSVCDKVCTDFFKVREDFMPHGSMFYRVITKSEKESRKFDNQSCKFGCTENRLIKWCAKCNDREKDRKKEIQISKNNARKDQALNSDEIDNFVLRKNDNNKITDKRDQKFEISTVEELTQYIENLTLYDIDYEHTYAEGVVFTIADIMLFVYFYHLLESMSFQGERLFKHIPHIHKWLRHVISLPRIQDTSISCGYDMKLLKSCLNDRGKDTGNMTFTIPDRVLDLAEGNTDISRRSRAKVRALKNEIARVLDKIEENGIFADVGSHPRGTNVHVSWDSLPSEASPKVELPEKRVKRKCEQLENLATAVQEISKPGDIIVDFCSGGGHLGIIIAYLLPDCKVYMVENNEESLKRATKRVKALKLSNVVLYQCNLGYFKGDFDVGVCLHACGVATDMVLQQCIDRKASFVLCPCCYGSIQNTHLINYPRSQYYRKAGFTDKDVILLGHAADQTEFNTDLQSQGRHCMNLVDTDRASLAKENGYTVTLCSLQPLTCTPKNNLLIGRAPV